MNKGNQSDIRIQCQYDFIPSAFVKPSNYFEGSSVNENFKNFWKLSVCVNTALMQLLVKEKSIPLSEKDYAGNIANESDEAEINDEFKEEEPKIEEITPT